MITIRQDDWDFRLDLEKYKRIHDEFLKRGLVETANIQFTQYGNMCDIRPEVIDFLNNTPGFDIQLHGWEHLYYSKETFGRVTRDLAASCYFFQKYFNKLPQVWYPPWNDKSPETEKAAAQFGITIDNESYDIDKFIREVENETYNGHSVYFHGWHNHDTELLEKMLDLVLTLDKDKKKCYFK